MIITRDQLQRIMGGAESDVLALFASESEAWTRRSLQVGVDGDCQTKITLGLDAKLDSGGAIDLAMVFSSGPLRSENYLCLDLMGAAVEPPVQRRVCFEPGSRVWNAFFTRMEFQSVDDWAEDTIVVQLYKFQVGDRVKVLAKTGVVTGRWYNEWDFYKVNVGNGIDYTFAGRELSLLTEAQDSAEAEDEDEDEDEDGFRFEVGGSESVYLQEYVRGAQTLTEVSVAAQVRCDGACGYLVQRFGVSIPVRPEFVWEAELQTEPAPPPDEQQPWIPRYDAGERVLAWGMADARIVRPLSPEASAGRRVYLVRDGEYYDVRSEAELEPIS